MPRSNRDYLLRYADQCINDIERALERLQLLSDAYAGNYKPLEGEIQTDDEKQDEGYAGAHGQHQHYVDVNAELLLTVRENIIVFRKNYM